MHVDAGTRSDQHRLSRPQLTALRTILLRRGAMQVYHRLAEQPTEVGRLIDAHRAELPELLRELV